VRRGVVALVAAGLLGLSACSGVGDTGSNNYITGEGQVSTVEPAERGEPIELTGEGLEGETLDVNDWRGQVVVVNVWGSWCPPCRAEQDELVEAARETEGTAQFVGVNIRDSSVENARAFVRKYDVGYPSIYSPDSRALLAFNGTLTPYSVPSTVLLDHEGRVAASIMGRIPSVLTLTDLIEDVASGQESPGEDAPETEGTTGRDG
jgi:thiol-disulfide isomerase/thioredoxin